MCVCVCKRGGSFVCLLLLFFRLFVCLLVGVFFGGGWGVVVGYILGYINAFDKVCSHLNI